MCAYCLILMNFLDFKGEFKNFTDFENARISKILFAIMSWNKSCFQVFSIMCFSSGKSFLWQKKFLLHQIRNIFHDEFCWSLFLLLLAWANMQNIHVSMFYANSANKYCFIMIFRSPFLICKGFSKIKMNLTLQINGLVSIW